MDKYLRDYQKIYSELGRELTPGDACPESEVAAAEARLGLRVPKALRDYYLVAGREDGFNRAHDRLLPPGEWFVDQGHLVFQEENQSAVYWGVEAAPGPPDDPPVFQGVNDDSIRWFREHDSCRVFLTATLHWSGAFAGAMEYTGTVAVPADLVARLDRDWVFAGEVNAMRAYRRPGQAVCFLEWRDLLPGDETCSPWRIFAGASTEKKLKEIEKSLNVKLEDDCD
jgi:hypothetical protein